jgi:transcription initiation protein SPT3
MYLDGQHVSITSIGKRFRDFLNLPPQLDLKAADDTIDIVGFLAFEMVRSLTLGGLAIKRSLEDIYELQDLAASTLGKRPNPTASNESPSKRRRSDSPDQDQPPVSTLFLPPPEARTALRPEHIQDAFARSQRDWSHHRAAGLRNFRGGLVRTNVSLI